MTIVTDQTRFIEVATGNYPVTFDMIRELKKASVSFGPSTQIEDVQGLGYEPVVDTIIPTGDIVTEGAPELVDGVWNRTWNVRSYAEAELATALQEAKDVLSTKIDEVRENDLAYGMRFNFADGTTGGIQMRPKDRTNLIGIRLEAYAYIQNSLPDTTIEFRSLENVTRELKATEVVALTDACTEYTKQIYAASWALKDTIAATTLISQLPALETLPTTFTLPPS